MASLEPFSSITPTQPFLQELSRNPFKLDVQKLAGIFTGNLLNGGGITQITQEVFELLPKDKQSSGTYAEVEAFATTVVSKLSGDDAKKQTLTPEERVTALEKFYTEWDATKYAYGGNSKDGVDCSHFVQKAYEAMGIDYKYTTASSGAWDKAGFVKLESDDDLRPGDLIVFSNNGTKHVGIVLDPENKIFIGSQSTPGVDDDSFGAESYWGKRVTEFWRHESFVEN